MFRRLWADRAGRTLIVAYTVLLFVIAVLLVVASQWPVAEVMP